MKNIKERPFNWDFDWCVIQIEHANWAVTYNGHIVEAEFASERDAQNKAWAWETEMAHEWGIYA